LKLFNKRFTVCFILYLCSFLLILGTVINSQENNEVGNSKAILAIINNNAITLEDFYQYWDVIPDQYKAQLNKEDLLEQLIIQTLLVQRANEINLNNSPEVAFQIKNTTEQILIQYLIEKEIVEKTEINDDEIKSYYDEHKENYFREEQIHVLNILTETEEEAIDALKKLGEGIDFSILAQEVSIAASVSKGGDIGFISKGTLNADIEDQLFILDSGDLSEIITTDKGFNIFKIIEKVSSYYLELDEVREEIKYQLLPQKQQQAFDQYLKDIEERATIEKNLELIQE